MTDLLLLDAPHTDDPPRPGTAPAVVPVAADGGASDRGGPPRPAVPPGPHDPVVTADELVQRVRETVPVAVRRQLWTLFFGPDDVQLPLMVPLEGVPTVPDVDALVHYGEALEAVAVEFGAASLAFVLERVGSRAIRSSDTAWLDGLRRATDGRRFDVRPVLLCSDDGVRVLGRLTSPPRQRSVGQASSSPVRLVDSVRRP